MNKTKLSERVRPDCEAAPWVIEEIKRLEAAIEAKAAPVGELRQEFEKKYPAAKTLVFCAGRYDAKTDSSQWKHAVCAAINQSWDDYQAGAAHQRQQAREVVMPDIKELVHRFLACPLPESLCSDPSASMPGYPHRTGTNLMTAEQAEAMIEYVIAAPRQPEGEAISRERVQAEADAFFDWPTTDKSSVTTTSCLIFARCIAGMVAAERDATIAELREELDAAREILAQQGRRNTELRAERDTLRQQRDSLKRLLIRACLDISDSDLIQRIDSALAEVKL